MNARTVSRLALLVAIATTLQIAESLIPKPVPWLRLGLANAVTLLALIRLGAAAAVGVTLTRVLLGGLLLGTIGSPTFALSLAGSLAAWLVMWVAIRVRVFSVLGASILGASAHVAAQLLVLSFLLSLGSGVTFLAPGLLLTAVPLGAITGAVVLVVDRRLVPWQGSW